MKPYQKTSPRVQPDNTRLVCHVFVDHPLNLEERDCRPPRIQKQTKNPLPLQGKQSPRVRPSKSRIVCDVFGDRPPNLPRTYVRTTPMHQKRRTIRQAITKASSKQTPIKPLRNTTIAGPARQQPYCMGKPIIAGSTRQQSYCM